MRYMFCCLFTLLLAVPSVSSAMDNTTVDTYAYYYFMKGTPEAIRDAVPPHVSYWKSLHLKGYQGGPFGDKSGGLIVFKTKGIESAKEIISNDPFVKRDLIGIFWIKKWVVHN